MMKLFKKKEKCPDCNEPALREMTPEEKAGAFYEDVVTHILSHKSFWEQPEIKKIMKEIINENTDN